MDKKCLVDGCLRDVHALGLCVLHYGRKWRYGTVSLTRGLKCDSVLLLEKGLGFCSKCKKEKEVSEFNKDKHTITGYARYCRKCNGERSSLRYLLHPDEHKNTQLKSDFGITLLEYKKILSEQNGVCDICGQSDPTKNKRLAVDHDHRKNKVRGLLCSKCNNGIGLFQDNVKLLEKAILYLKKHE